MELVVRWKTFQHEASSSLFILGGNQLFGSLTNLDSLRACGKNLTSDQCLWGTSTLDRVYTLNTPILSASFLLSNQSWGWTAVYGTTEASWTKNRVLKCQRAIPRLVSNDLVMQNVLLHQLYLKEHYWLHQFTHWEPLTGGCADMLMC